LPWFRRGGAVAICYQHLHEAEVLLARLSPPEEIEAAIPRLLVKARHVLHACDERREAIYALAKPRDTGEVALSPERRAAYVNGLRVTYGIADLGYGQVRRLRNNLVVAASVLACTVVLSGLVGAFHPRALPLCSVRTGEGPDSTLIVACPTDEREIEDEDLPSAQQQADDFAGRWDLFVVALFGLMGATLSAAIWVSRTPPPTDTPYDLPLYNFIFKLSAGALTAIVGLFLVKGEFVPGLSALDTQAQILAYAVLFGFAQQVFTQWIDTNANELLKALPGRTRSAPPADDDSDGAGRRRGRSRGSRRG
jgi:hypothetical protein